MLQFDIFGNEVELEDIPTIKRGRKPYSTMQQVYGVLKGLTCKDCKHCLRLRYHNKNYYKCDLWIISNSEATDIRLKDVACEKYEQNKGE